MSLTNLTFGKLNSIDMKTFVIAMVKENNLTIPETLVAIRDRRDQAMAAYTRVIEANPCDSKKREHYLACHEYYNNLSNEMTAKRLHQIL